MKVLITDLLLLIFTVSVVVADRQIRCYQCNMANDSNCDSSDLKDLYIKSCPLLKEGTYAGRKPIGCRKIVQNVEDLPAQIIRECAYTGDKQIDGMRKQGNKAIKILYYQCENVDGDKPCNGAQQTTMRNLSFILLLTIIIGVVQVKYQ